MLTHNLSLLSTDTAWSNNLLKEYENFSSTLRTLTQYLILIASFSLVGRLFRNAKLGRDTGLFAAALVFSHRDLLFPAIVHAIAGQTSYYLSGTLVVQAVTATWVQRPVKQKEVHVKHSRPQILESMILPCRTTHARLFPTKHSFSYSYLFVGVPVDLNGSTGSVVVAGDRSGTRSWFTVHAQDYLARGEHENGFAGKLKDYLISQRISAESYSHAYLVTAPRFLGFSFNPVSFWYLYDQIGSLAAMILEVNNTFDERRMYFMQRKLAIDGRPSPEFSNSWSKDFHVSPFNDRHGSYSLTATNPATTGGDVKVDNNIVLRDIEGKPKLVARVYSTESAISLSTLSRIQQGFFIARWWWVGFMTNPRILREARILWVKKLQVFYRPEVFRTSIGRNETTREVFVEPFFREFLLHLASSCDEEVTISYTPGAGKERGKVIRIYQSYEADRDEPRNLLDIHVTTPAWYHEILRCHSIEHAFSKYCFEAADGEAMIHVSDHATLQKLLGQYISKSCGKERVTRFTSFNEWAVSHLRCRTMDFRHHTSLSRPPDKQERQFMLSDFDHFVRSNHPDQDYEAYLGAVRSVLFADCIAFGFGWLLSTYRFIIRSVCIWYLSRQAIGPMRLDQDIGRPLKLILCIIIYHGGA